MAASRLFDFEAGRVSVEWRDVAWGGCRWGPVGVSCRLANGSEHTSDTWRRPSQAGAGRVRLRTRAGPLDFVLELTEAAGGQVRVRVEASARGEVAVQSIGLVGQVSVGGRLPRWILYNGYQSWDPAGQRLADQAEQRSWWTCGLAVDAGPGIAAAALSSRHAVTVFNFRAQGQGVLEIAQQAADGVCGPPPLWRAGRAGALWRGEWVALAAGSDARQALRQVALAAAPGSGSPARLKAPQGWLSWYQFGPWVSPGNVLDNAIQITDGHLGGCGYRVVQIDDGWQEAWGDWLPNARFGAGLQQLTAELRARDLVGGIWVAPFLVSETAVLAEEAPESWFLRDGSRMRALDPREEPTRRFHVLDLRQPAVRRHLEETFDGLYEMGFRYFKIDFLYAGAYSGVSALRAAVRAIRRAIRDSYLTACGAPLLPLVGLVDSCRIGRDTATPIFDFERGEPRPAFVDDEILAIARNLSARHFLQPWFHLDADVALVGGGSSLEEARQLVTMVAISGGPFMAGDDLAGLDPDRRALLTNLEVLRLVGGPPAVPDWQPHEKDRPPTIWRRPDGLVAVFNWEPREQTLEVDLGDRARGQDRVLELWSGRRLEVTRGVVRLQLPARGAGLIRALSG